MTVENGCSDQEGEKCVEKNVEELDKFFCLCPNDIHDGLFEIFLIDLIVMVVVMMVMVVVLMMYIALLSQLIVQMEEIRQSFVLISFCC